MNLKRLKFDISPIVSHMLDSIPRDIIIDGVICDPAMGGGQFVAEIERRKREAGKTDAEIKRSTWGFESSQLRVNYAVNVHGLVGTYGAGDVLMRDFDGMKFDVVIGNPPYRSQNEKGGKHSLWRKFVKKSFELLADDGYVAMVCPGFPYQASDLASCFTKNTPCLLVNDATQHFPGVGSEIKYWIVRQGKHEQPFIVDGQIWEHGLAADPTADPLIISIKSKMSGLPLFECKQDRGYNSTQYKNDDADYFEKPRGTSIYPIRHASTVKICYVSRPTECHNKNKVMMTFSGYPDFTYYDGLTNPISSCYQMSGYIEVSDATEGAALIQVYTSKLYTFLSNIDGAGMKGISNYMLPKVDLTRSWTDQDLYTHVNLSADEITYIESSVK